jgi:hypothetical protein
MGPPESLPGDCSKVFEIPCRSAKRMRLLLMYSAYLLSGPRCSQSGMYYKFNSVASSINLNYCRFFLNQLKIIMQNQEVNSLAPSKHESV